MNNDPPTFFVGRNKMNTITTLTRKLLQTAELDTTTTFSKKPFDNTTGPLDSSMAITILALLATLFLMAFFSLYIRRFSANNVHQSLPSKNRGLDASVINSLPLIAYDKPAKHRMIDDCPICLGELHEGELVKLIPYCGHVFHPKCVDTWLKMHVTCPLCRSAQLFKGVSEVSLDVAKEMSDTCTGSSDMRRTRSCCDLRHDRVLRRSTSF